MTTAVTSHDVIEHFAGRSAHAQRLLNQWRRHAGRVEVVPAVESHVAVVAHEQTPTSVADVCRQTEHALGNVKWAKVKSVASIHDWHPNFAFTHVLHQDLEERGHIPTWQELKVAGGPWHSRIRGVAIAQRDQAAEVLRRSGATEAEAKHLASDAMQWRLGNAYYSFLRELFVVATLRDSGIDARCHPLADALFRADAWVDNTVISLYIGNPKYLTSVTGRKNSAAQLLSDARPPFTFLAMELATQHKFGVVHLPDPLSIVNQAAHLATS